MLDEFRKTLRATADTPRANVDAAECRHLVLGLIFLKYISGTFQARRVELTARFADPVDDYFSEGSAAEASSAELEDRECYREANVFWIAAPGFLSIGSVPVVLPCPALLAAEQEALA